MTMELKYNKTYDEKVIRDFASNQWDKVLSYLQGQFQLSRTDCEDIFQESFIILYQQIVAGRLDEMTASLSTYFTSICRNKAFELMKGKGKEVMLEDQFAGMDDDEYRSDMVDRILAMEDEDEDIVLTRRKASLVRQIVRNLPSPCNELLWAFYRDGFSMKTMAEMFHYSSESAVKVTKHRCCEKFKARFEESQKSLY